MQQTNKKLRLDDFLAEKGYFKTKSKAHGNILAGKVKVNGEVITKAGTQINPDKIEKIEIESMPYVGRGGFKLEKALKEFNINLKGKICLDAGASTGGFTDCMLQNGAAKVYAVDVGYGQLAWKLRNHPQVEVIERTNIRKATVSDIYKNEINLAEFCAADLSFISLKKVLANIKNLLNPENHEIIALIKPQFEAEKENVPKSGVVKDKNIHVKVIENIVNYACEINLCPINLTWSPVQGPAGNTEYLIHLKKTAPDLIYKDDNFKEFINKTVNGAYEHFDKNKIKK